MPRYEYTCPAGDPPFLLNRPIDERDAPAPCPVCGAAATRALAFPTVAQKAPRQADGALAVPRTAPRPRTYAEGHAHGPDGSHIPSVAEVDAARRPLPADAERDTGG